jgi:hypothetical protein
MGRAASDVPSPSDAQWADWRRAQVTSFVRRLYLNVVAQRPRIKVSAAVVTFGGGPVDDSAWLRMEPYWRVYQDWRSWLEEGIVDVMVPMVYKTEHTASGRESFVQWSSWTAGHQYARHAVIGLGAYLNSIEGSLLQVREATAVTPEGTSNRGVSFFSMAASNAPVMSNPLSVPAGRDTPLRTFEDFASGLVTGRAANGQTLDASGQEPVFAWPAAVPVMPWKQEPRTGHLMGYVRAPDGSPLDTATVIVGRADGGLVPEPAEGRLSAAVETDGLGFYGAVDLAPGSYSLMITPRNAGGVRSTCTVEISAGAVASLDLVVDGRSPLLAECVTAAGPARRR